MIDLLFNPVYDPTGVMHYEWYWRGTWEIGGRTMYGKAQGPFEDRQQAIEAFQKHWRHSRPTRDIRFTEGDNV